jgi:hypothetical protein
MLVPRRHYAPWTLLRLYKRLVVWARLTLQDAGLLRDRQAGIFVGLLEELEAICCWDGDRSPAPSSGETKPDVSVAA